MSRIPCNVVLLFLLLTPLAQRATAAVSPAQDVPLDEVVVEGTRGQLKKMVQEMVKLEDQFYARYNELNLNDDFDMHCDLEARVRTKIKRRFCRAVYEERALRIEGQEWAVYMQNNPPASVIPGMPPPPPPPMMGGPPHPAMMTIEARREEYKDNMREVTKRNPELVELLRERYEMAQRYEATRRKVWGLKPPPEEEDDEVAPPSQD